MLSSLMCISFNLLTLKCMQVKKTIKLTLHRVPVRNGQWSARDKAIQTPRCLKICHVSVMSGEQVTDKLRTGRSFLDKRDSDEKTVEWCHTVICYSNCFLQGSRQKWEESTGVRSHSLGKCYLPTGRKEGHLDLPFFGGLRTSAMSLPHAESTW